MSTATIDAKSFADRVKANSQIPVVDVRTPGEFQSVHLSVAKNIPLDQLSRESVSQVTNGASSPLYVVCQSGARGQRAVQQLQSLGIEAVNVEGGTKACLDAGIPAIRGRGAISIDRQVRITAGGLTLLGVLLGFFVHPAFYILSGFIGSGLLFAGLTDTCGMAMMLAKMPWNQASSKG